MLEKTVLQQLQEIFPMEVNREQADTGEKIRLRNDEQKVEIDFLLDGQLEQGYGYKNSEAYIRESCLAFESLTQETSIVFVLNRKSDTFELPYIAICRTDKKYGEYVVNQITSIYDKEKLESLIQRTYDANKKFYVNEKSRAFIKSAELQLPINLINALSTSYDKQCLTKSQVEQDLSKSKSYGSETQLDEVKEDVEEYEMDIAEDRW